MRRLIDRSFETKAEQPAIETRAPYVEDGTVAERTLRVSSHYLRIGERSRTLLCIDDVSVRALPAGELVVLRSPEQLVDTEVTVAAAAARRGPSTATSATS